VVAPACVDYGLVVIALMASFELCTDRMSGFTGPGNASSFCKYFVEPSLPASRWLVGGRMRQPRMLVGLSIPGSQDFVPGAETQFHFSRNM
jgi:hypothetical protein